METSFSDYAKAEAEIAKINATIDVEVTKIRDKYADKIANLQQIKDDNFDVLQAYALENRDTPFHQEKNLSTAFTAPSASAQAHQSSKPSKGSLGGLLPTSSKSFYLSTYASPKSLLKISFLPTVKTNK